MVNTVTSLVQSFSKVPWRVVSVGVELLSLGSQMNTFTAIFLDLLFTTIVVLVLSLHVDLLRLGVRVLGSGGVGLECCRLQLLLLHIELLGLFFR